MFSLFEEKKIKFKKCARAILDSDNKMPSCCPRKHGGCDVTGVKLGYSVHAVNHWPGLIYLQATQNSPPGLAIENIFADWLVDQNI